MLPHQDPRKLGRPNREEAERISDHVLDTATRLFADRGYAATSIAAIAAAAKVGKHTIYRRYPDKSDLFRSVVRRKAEEILAGDELQQPASGPLGELQALVHRAARAAVSPDMLAIYRMTVGEAQQFPELASIVMRVEGDRLVAHIADLVAAAQRRGELAPGEPEFIARFLVDAVTSYLFHHALAGQDFVADEVTQHVERCWKLFLQGAAPRR